MIALKQINKEIEDFKNKQVQIVPGLPFNQYDTVQKIIFYYNSKFTTGETDDEGDRKYFYNVTRNPCKVCSKAIDFDTKNIRLLTAGGGDPLKTWFMERDLKHWMREQNFGKVLNRIFKELPIFGSVVLKIVQGKPLFVDLRNFVVTQSADSLDGANYIIEIHNYSVAEFRKVAKQMGWDANKVNEVVEKFHQMRDASHIRIYERYGEVGEEIDGVWKYEYKRVFFADVGVDEFDQYGRLVADKLGVELECKKWDGHPYREFHMEKMPGRWLGVGVVETLFEPQIKQNELANLQSKASYFAALHIWQTRDPNFNRNLVTDVRNGEVLFIDSEITQVAMDERNLAFFSEETNKWLRNRDEMTFSYDVVQGERLPAGTPLGSAQIAIGQTLSYFEQIQEDVAMDVKAMLYDVIIPQFEKERTTEHVLRLVGQDLDAFVEMVSNELVLVEMIRMAANSLTGAPFPTNEDRELARVAIAESVKQGKEKLLTVPKGFYKDLKYDVDIDITGESVDTRVKAATKFAILQAITADPSLLQDPAKRKLLGSYMEDGGLNAADFLGVQPVDMGEMMNMAPQGRAGGGVSAPSMGASVPGQSSQTV